MASFFKGGLCLSQWLCVFRCLSAGLDGLDEHSMGMSTFGTISYTFCRQGLYSCALVYQVFYSWCELGCQMPDGGIFRVEKRNHRTFCVVDHSAYTILKKRVPGGEEVATFKDLCIKRAVRSRPRRLVTTPTEKRIGAKRRVEGWLLCICITIIALSL